mgnify:CR=1 FL=1
MTEETLEPVETETDPEERIRELTAENRRLRKQIKRMREAAATSKKVEFSKIIFCGVSIVTISITVFSCWIIYSTMDTSALAYLIPAVFAEMASATGFYYTKAKAETNQIDERQRRAARGGQLQRLLRRWNMSLTGKNNEEKIWNFSHRQGA